jgi:hypothetical protein
VTIQPESAVNVAVNENPANTWLSLLTCMPSDQDIHRTRRLLHTGTTD